MTNFEKWKYYLRDIESPDIYIEWGFLHLISSALQRRVWFHSDAKTGLPGSHSFFANDYVILVGRPSTGKGRVITQSSSIIKSPRLERPNMEGKLYPLIPYSPDKITLEKLTQHIAASSKSVAKKIDEKTTLSYAYCPCCFLIEELDVLFAQNTNDMVSVIVHCYDSHSLHYATKHQGEDKIENVCVTMLAGTTPDSVRDLMANKIIKKGFASRSIFVFADEPRFYRQFPGIDAEQQEAYNQLLGYVKDLTNVFGEVTLSPEAKEYHKRLYESGITHKSRINKDPRLDDYYGRKNLHWLKLATTLHFSEEIKGYEIQKESLERAFDILQRTEYRMHEAFVTAGRNILHEQATLVVRYLQSKERVSYSTMRWDFNKDLTKTELDEVIETLLTAGKIKRNSEFFSLTVNGKESQDETQHKGIDNSNEAGAASSNIVNLQNVAQGVSN